MTPYEPYIVAVLVIVTLILVAMGLVNYQRRIDKPKVPLTFAGVVILCCTHALAAFGLGVLIARIVEVVR
jgi:hypothetical protein